MSENSTPELTYTVDDVAFGPGLTTDDRHLVEHCLRQFWHRASNFPRGSVEARVSVKDREHPSQRTIIECDIKGLPRLVAHSDEANVKDALHEACDRMVAQINKEVAKHRNH